LTIVGHMPPHLAGREREYKELERLLGQDTILENMVLTGLRGGGKTVLLETFKPRAIEQGWLWAGTDVSASASVSEINLALRLMTDLSVITSALLVTDSTEAPAGFSAPTPDPVPRSYDVLASDFESVPGLVADKIKAVLEFALQRLRRQDRHRVIFAYDEAYRLLRWSMVRRHRPAAGAPLGDRTSRAWCTRIDSASTHSPLRCSATSSSGPTSRRTTPRCWCSRFCPTRRPPGALECGPSAFAPPPPSSAWPRP
jgi:hypothetical protein